MSVTTLLDRLDDVAKPEREGGHPEGRQARALLEKRGLTSDVVDQARGLLAKVGTVPEGAELVEATEPDAEAAAKAETRMWNWYLEWSSIARTVIHDRSALRALGFLRRMRRADGRDVDVVVDDDDIEDVEDDSNVIVGPANTAQPAGQPAGQPAAGQPTAATPKPEPEPAG